MDTSTVRFRIERQGAEGGWEPLVGCNSLDYARLIAAVGHRRGSGSGYRLIHVRTGRTIVLPAAATAKAA